MEADRATREKRPGYWEATRQPISSLVFVLPLLTIYELGVIRLGGALADDLRTGADAWIRRALLALGLRESWLPPAAISGALLLWQVFRSGTWKFRPSCLVGMLVESLVLAMVLVGLGHLVDLGFDHIESATFLKAEGPGSAEDVAPLIGFLGAGIFEEAIFRLAMIPALYGLARILHTPEVIAGTLAVTGSALSFSLAHHAGTPGEAFTAFAFIFRWLAGIFFAWVFLKRGFGIAVGTHAAYDVLVGWAGLHF